MQVERDLHFEPRGPLGWIVGVLVLAAVIGLALFFLTVFLVLLGVAVVVTPIVVWWRRKTGRSGKPRVIDAEFTVQEGPREE